MSNRYASLVERAVVRGNLLDVIRDLQRRLATLERSHPGPPGTTPGTVAYFPEDGILDVSVGSLKVRVVDDNVSSPPTDAQLDSAFGAPADLGSGFVGIVDDNGAESAVYLCVVVGTSWWYEALTKAS